MDLQITVFLLFVFFTAGHSLRCYGCMGLTGSCANQNEKTCPSGTSMCTGTTTVTQAAGISVKVKLKDCSAACATGNLNLGIVQLSSTCCNTDLCNAQDAPDPSTASPNGLTCYYCDDKSCSNTVSCSGSEDRCIKATGTFGGQTLAVKGCASKSFCNGPDSTVESVSCCSGNLCNGAKSVTQSFLFLCGSLISFIILH